MANDLGVAQGKLQACPDTPNCIASQADPGDEQHYVSPLNVAGRPLVISTVAAVLAEQPRTKIVAQTDSYLHAEVRSRVFGFVDDLELYVDDTETLHFRSASRRGRSDLGVNRKRVEALKTRLEAAL